MAQFRKKMAEVVQEHQLKAYGYIPDLNDLLNYNHGDLCKYYFNALTYFRRDNHYESLEEVIDPTPGDVYFVRKKNTRLTYQWDGQKWRFLGDTPDSAYY